jgi:hypothetical protein
LKSTAIVVAFGASSRRSSSRFVVKRARDVDHAGGVATRTAEARHKTQSDRIATAREDDRNRCCCRLGCDRRSTAASCHDHGDLTADQIGGKARQSVVLTFGPPVFDRDVLAFDVAYLAEAATKGGDEGREPGR